MDEKCFESNINISDSKLKSLRLVSCVCMYVCVHVEYIPKWCVFECVCTKHVCIKCTVYIYVHVHVHVYIHCIY